MYMSLNKHMIIGNLGDDAVLKTLDSGKKVLNFSVATNEPYKTVDGKWDNITTWHNVSLFNPSDYKVAGLKKGANVYVEGPIRKSEYMKDDKKNIFVKIVAEKVDILDKVDLAASNASVADGSPAATDDDLPF